MTFRDLSNRLTRMEAVRQNAGQTDAQKRLLDRLENMASRVLDYDYDYEPESVAARVALLLYGPESSEETCCQAVEIMQEHVRASGGEHDPE